PGGPDLSTMILQPSDVGQWDPADVFLQRYIAFTPALSAYQLDLRPAGPYDDVEQLIGWWPTATEATCAEAYVSALFAKEVGVGSPIDLSAVGDNATGSLFDGGDGPYVLVTLTNGQAGEFIYAHSASTVQDSDVQSLA